MDDKNTRRQGQEDIDELSVAASSRAEQESFQDEDLPTYQDEHPGSSSSFPEEKTSNRVPPIHGETTTTTSPPTHGPTTSAPFDFPTTTQLPDFTASSSTNQQTDEKPPFLPIAIPQATPTPTSAFLPCYAPQLLNYGIPSTSWHSFLTTLSAFLSAKISQQALHHAADISAEIGTYHRTWGNNMKKSFKRMGDSAKHFNPFGVLGSAIGITVGTVTHGVGSIVGIPGHLMKKPQTPRERADVYLAAANRDWFAARGLKAGILDVKELCRMLGVSAEEFLGQLDGGGSPEEQMGRLKGIVGDVKVSEAETETGTSGKAAGKRPWKPQLLIERATLWLVIVPVSQDEEETSAVEKQA